MNIFHFCCLSTCVFTIVGCTPTHKSVGIATGHTNSNVKSKHQRINTADCQDADDWYLDGYRVGKSFATQKADMLQQRANYCRYHANKLPNKFKQNWEKGFVIGNQETAKARPKTQKRRS